MKMPVVRRMCVTLLAISCAAACDNYSGSLPPAGTDPPIEPVAVSVLQLFTFHHEMQARNNHVVRPPPIFDSNIVEIWNRCRIAVAYHGTGRGPEKIVGRTASDDTITLGERFTSSRADHSVIQANWTAITAKQVNPQSGFRRGIDFFYARNVYITGAIEAGGISMPGVNRAVLPEPSRCNAVVNATDCRRNAAHELGHMLGLGDRSIADGADQWVMSEYLFNTGDGLEGLNANGTIVPNSECYNARRHGTNQHYTENGY